MKLLHPPYPKHKTHIFVVVITICCLLLSGCLPTDQHAIETQAASLIKTSVAKSADSVATQLDQAKATAEAVAATEAIKLKQTLEAALPGAETPAPGQVNAEVQAARDILKKDINMTNPWKQIDAPIKNGPGQRSFQSYANVIDQFDVTALLHAGRYQSGGVGVADTRCNIFAGDVMRAMGVALPTKGNLGKGQGSAGSQYTDPMTANAEQLNDYLNKRLKWVTSADDAGVESDWVEIFPSTPEDLQRLIQHVYSGKPALVSDSGHIAVVRPEQKDITNWQDLIIAQAGAANFLVGTIKNHFFGTPQFFIKE